MSRVAFFDLDRTLIDVNSGSLWLRYEWEAGNAGVRDVTWAVWVLLRYSFGVGHGMDDAYRAAALTLKGKTEESIDARTKVWFEERVRARLRPGAKDALARHREAGDRLVLATASSPYAARAAAKAFGLDAIICTEFEVVDGVFTGEVRSPAWGDEKAVRVGEFAARETVDLAKAAFYTDSMTDLTLLEQVGEPVCVNPDRRLARVAATRGWPVIDWGTSG